MPFLYIIADTETDENSYYEDDGDDYNSCKKCCYELIPDANEKCGREKRNTKCRIFCAVFWICSIIVSYISTGKHRIIIDFGANLPDNDNEDVMTDEELTETVFGGRPCDGVLFTHYHGDHIVVHFISSVCIKKTPIILIRFQIKPKRPNPPKNIYMPVADASVPNINES